MEEVVLCAASVYEKKYYLNPLFERLPEAVKTELHIMCVLFTEEVGGIISLIFDNEGSLRLEVSAKENDLLFDEIGSDLKIKKIKEEKKELFNSIELYYKVVILKEHVDL
ncbi:hypothetical protein SAMN05216249_105124 [Acetitomaculum ruminis DSM 5522]|uniref:Uncharacterized protein n=1 Tax=Acetitomaculum ruminis DSM 5522 TaxID=1120918 RepID=A0A1I0X2F4_9FIRM|nr:DUF6145 family protein [Acetitomaculum ruminis]SFA94600.1 hypothetical protein SAMN05216249_105124 [Acetitomaculum ruminis DSM 5522]